MSKIKTTALYNATAQDDRPTVDRLAEANALMGDSLRLGELTAKEQLDSKLKLAKVATKAAAAAYAKSWEPVRKSIERQAALLFANDSDLAALLSMFHKLTRAEKSDKISLKEWLQDRCFHVGNSRTEWYRIGNYPVGDHNKFAALLRRPVSFLIDSPLVPHTDADPDEQDHNIYASATLDLGPLLEDFVAAGDLLAAAQATESLLTHQLEDLPRTIKVIERQLLEARLSSTPNGVRAMSIVGNAIEALQSGNATLLLP